jgi:hypothetical protein
LAEQLQLQRTGDSIRWFLKALSGVGIHQLFCRETSNVKSVLLMDQASLNRIHPVCKLDGGWEWESLLKIM